MNFFEKLMLGLLSAAPSTVPIFVHSSHGLAVLNASETLLAGVLSEFAPAAAPAAPAPTSAS